MEIVAVIAVLLSPLIALRVETWIRIREDARRRKVDVFRRLMSTRGAQMSPTHVDALNSIEVEFHEVQSVTAAWRNYIDHLGQPYPPEQSAQWGATREGLHTELLLAMAAALGFKFERNQLLRHSYYPKGYGTAEFENMAIRKKLVDHLTHPGGFPIVIYRPEDVMEEDAAEAPHPAGPGPVPPAEPEQR